MQDVFILGIAVGNLDFRHAAPGVFGATVLHDTRRVLEQGPVIKAK